MKELRKNSFKCFSLTLVQISLIAGSIALGVNTSKCSKSISTAKVNSYQDGQSKDNSSDFLLVDHITQAKVKTNLISLAVKSIAENHFVVSDPAHTLRSGLSPPLLLI